MRRYLNLFFTELAALFLSCLFISCSALFNSSDTGSVSFSLSSDQLRSIVAQPQSARTLMQGDEPIVEDEGEKLTLQIGIYDYKNNSYKYLAGAKSSVSLPDIHDGGSLSVTIDDVPVGECRLLALVYSEYTTDTNYNCYPRYCGAEQMIVHGGSNTVPVEMIDFWNAFEIEGEGQQFSADDEQLGFVRLLISEDKPFYALYSANCGLISLGVYDVSEWYPGKTLPSKVNLIELAGMGNYPYTAFDFLKSTVVMNVISTYEENPEEMDNYKVTYPVTYYNKAFDLSGNATIYMNETFTINAQDGTKFPAYSNYQIIFTEILGTSCYYIAATGTLEKASRTIINSTEKVIQTVKESVNNDEYFNMVMEYGTLNGYVPVKYSVLVTYTYWDEEEKTVKLISTDESTLKFYIKNNSVASTGFKTKEGDVNFIYTLSDSGTQYTKLPENASNFVLLMANNGDFVGQGEQKCYTLQELFDAPKQKLSIPVGRFNGFKDILDQTLYFRLSYTIPGETGAGNITYEGDATYTEGIDITSNDDVNISFTLSY